MWTDVTTLFKSGKFTISQLSTDICKVQKKKIVLFDFSNNWLPDIHRKKKDLVICSYFKWQKETLKCVGFFFTITYLKLCLTTGNI